jgi:N-acetylglucosamine kinase-like BadF-type ATPase
MSRSALVIGIDGGGTKTTALIADDQGHPLAQMQGKATNPHVVGFDAAAKTLSQLIQGDESTFVLRGTIYSIFL